MKSNKLTAVIAFSDNEISDAACEFLYEYGYKVVAVTSFFSDLVGAVFSFKPALALLGGCVGGSASARLRGFADAAEIIGTYVYAVRENGDTQSMSGISAAGIETLTLSATDFMNVDRRIRDGSAYNDRTQNKIYSCLLSLLCDLNISVRLIGHKYICDAVSLVLYEPELLTRLTSSLYPDIARMHGTSADAVERAMRTVIENAKLPRHMSVGEFIGYITESLRSEYN